MKALQRQAPWALVVLAWMHHSFLLGQETPSNAQAKHPQLAELEACLDESERHAQTLGERIRQWKAQTRRITELEATLAESDNANAELKTALEKAKKNEESAREAQQSVIAERDALANRLQDREQALATEKEAAAEASKLVDNLKTQSQQSETQLAQALEQLEHENERAGIKSEEHQKLANAVADYESRLKELQPWAEEGPRLRQALAEEKETLANKETRILTLTQSQKADRATIEELRREITALKQDAEAQQFKLRTERDQITEERQAALAALESQKLTRAKLDALVLRIDPIQYALNSASIEDEQARVLGQVQRILTVYPNAQFQISGHTCDIGSDERNQALSEQRAKRLETFLIANQVPSGQIQSAGYGETSPIATNDSEGNRRKNRRVEIRVSSPVGKTLLDTEKP